MMNREELAMNDIEDDDDWLMFALFCDVINAEAKESQQINTLVKRPKRKRKCHLRGDPQSSTWGLMLLNIRQQSEPLNKNHYLMKTFRLRFRLPYPLFLAIVEKLKASDEFKDDEEKCDALGRKSISLELKVLGALRILARSASYYEIEELSHIGKETVRSFFHRFIAYFGSDEVFSSYVHPPISEAAIAVTEEMYRKKGLPGCIGSVDCVHIEWDRCPSRRAMQHTGKEGCPTLSFEVVVDHCRRIQSATLGFAGSVNDKTIVRFDGYVKKLRDGTLFGDKTFKLLGKDGDGNQIVVNQQGYYLICDGGYHKWRVLQCPNKYTANENFRRLSQRIESLRKDVECTFGILKIRFKILKYPLLYRKEKTINLIFRTCCVLHNILLDVDGRDLASKAERNEINVAIDDEEEEEFDEAYVNPNTLGATEEEAGLREDEELIDEEEFTIGRAATVLEMIGRDSFQIGRIHTIAVDFGGSSYVSSSEDVEIDSRFRNLQVQLSNHLEIINEKARRSRRK